MKKRNYRKKKVMRKQANKAFWGVVTSDRTPLPNRFKTTLRYVETGVVLDPTLGGLADSYIFSCNGLFDPNISGTGHQCVGFDQLMSMYNHYTVIASKIRVEFINSDSTYNQTVGLFVSAGTTEQADIRVMIENGGCKYRTLGKAGGASSDRATLTSQVAPLKWLGKKGITDDQVRGSASANPVEQCYWHIFANDFFQSNNSAPVAIQVQIDYVVVFTEPKELALS